MPNHKNDIVEGIQKYFLLGILVLLIITLFIFISSFLSTLFIAAIIVAAIYPLHRLLNQKVRIPKTLSALITLLLTAVLIIAPLTYFFFSVVSQATDAYTAISAKINEFITSDYQLLSMLDRYPAVREWFDKILAYNPISTKDIVTTAGDFVGAISSFLLGQTTSILKHLSVFVLNTIVFLLAMFYFIRDGDRVVDYVHSLLPLREKYRNELFQKTINLMHSIVYGIFGAAIIQGILVGVGLALVGVENAAFWGAIAAILSPIPYIGTSIVWVPVVVVLFVTKSWLPGLFLLIWGSAVVGMSDNFIKPYIIGSASALHPLMVMLVILGGVFAFGFEGLIFGPLILTLTLAFLHIYQLEYQSVLKGKKPKALSGKRRKK